MAKARDDASQTRPTMTVSEYMEVSGLSRSTVYRGLRSGDIPGRKVLHTWVINRTMAMQQLGLA